MSRLTPFLQRKLARGQVSQYLEDSVRYDRLAGAALSHNEKVEFTVKAESARKLARELIVRFKL